MKVLVATEDTQCTGDIDGVVFHAAVLHFVKAENGALKVKATVDAYVDGAYQNKYLVGGQQNGSLQLISESEQSSSDCEEIHISRYPLLYKGAIVNIDNDIEQRGSSVVKLLFGAMKAVFANGVPLPTDHRFYWSSFEIKVSLPQVSYIEEICISHGTKSVGREYDRKHPDIGFQCSSSLHIDRDYDKNWVHSFDATVSEAGGQIPLEVRIRFPNPVSISNGSWQISSFLKPSKMLSWLAPQNSNN